MSEPNILDVIAWAKLITENFEAHRDSLPIFADAIEECGLPHFAIMIRMEWSPAHSLIWLSEIISQLKEIHHERVLQRN